MAGQDCSDGGLEDAGDGADFRPPAEPRWRRPRGPARPWRRATCAFWCTNSIPTGTGRSYLGRSDFVAGNFGENLTVEGLADDEVCIGDRFRIGGAVVEVSQPRDTCYRVGIRLNRPEIAALLVAHHRPGFYFRVIQEGEIGAGDRIEKLSDGPERMTVAEIDALLYSAEHPLEALRRAVRIPALSLDWQGSMQALLAAAEAGGTTGNAGLGLGASAPLAWRGFRPVVVVASREESADVRSFEFAAEDGSPLPPALPGQYIMVRVQAEPGCSRRHAKLFAVRSARHPHLSDWRQERARPRKRLSPPKRPGRQSPGDQRSAWLVHARCGCDARRPYQRRCRRHADVGDVAWRGCRERRGVSAGLVAAFSPRSGAPFVCQGGGRSARGTACVPSLRRLQSARAGRHARHRTSIDQAIFRPSCSTSSGFPRTLISICVGRPASSMISRKAWRHGAFPGPGSTSNYSGPRPRSRRASPAPPQPCRIVLTAPRAADPW